MTRELKGRHVLMIAISAFIVIVGANLAMLFAATGSFPGLVVKNSYVAGQGWNARTEAQQDLGWKTEVSYAEGAVRVFLTDKAGKPVLSELKVTVGRPTTDSQDMTRTVRSGAGPLELPMQLEHGLWRVEVQEATSGYRRTERLFVPEAG